MYIPSCRFQANRCRLFVIGLGWGASPLFVESAAEAGHGGFAYVAERGVAGSHGNPRASPGKIDVSPQQNGDDVRIDVVSLKSGVLGESFDVYSDAPQ